MNRAMDLDGAPTLLAGLSVLGLFGLVYLAATFRLGVAEARALVGRLTRRR